MALLPGDFEGNQCGASAAGESDDGRSQRGFGRRVRQSRRSRSRSRRRRSRSDSRSDRNTRDKRRHKRSRKDRDRRRRSACESQSENELQPEILALVDNNNPYANADSISRSTSVMRRFPRLVLGKLLDQKGLMFVACPQCSFVNLSACRPTKSWQAQLGVLVTAINPAWNAPATSDLSVTSFLMLIFPTTQQKPTTCISQLRCGDSYLQLAKVLRQTFNKLKRSSHSSGPKSRQFWGTQWC